MQGTGVEPSRGVGARKCWVCYRNPKGMGCNPMLDPVQNEAMILFASDPSNRVQEVKLDVSPLISAFAKYQDVFINTTQQLSSAGVKISFMAIFPRSVPC